MSTCLIKIKKSYPLGHAEHNGQDFYKGAGWYAYVGSCRDIPRSTFDVLVRTLVEGDTCPTCNEGKLFYYDVSGDFAWLYCDTCGDMDNDDWWNELKFRIRWRGSK